MIAAHSRPRLGFLGTGWIGRNRMEAIAASGVADIVMVADASRETAEGAAAAVGGARIGQSLGDLLDCGVDGVVIATPSALHAEQATAALAKGAAVFCQKPLARNALETRQVVDAARTADRLLGVDLSYRHTEGMRAVRTLVQRGELGTVYAADMVFHNAYGPDKPWFYDPQLSGGGCVIDLGIHLIDLALWTLDFPGVTGVESHLYAGGSPLVPGADGGATVEDFATATLALDSGASVRLACSWNLPAGRDAVIEATFYGTTGAASMCNVNGSFYDFCTARYRGTSRELVAQPPDAWGGRAAVAWATQLANGARFDASAERLVDVAAALDAVYGR